MCGKSLSIKNDGKSLPNDFLLQPHCLVDNSKAIEIKTTWIDVPHLPNVFSLNSIHDRAIRHLIVLLATFRKRETEPIPTLLQKQVQQIGGVVNMTERDSEEDLVQHPKDEIKILNLREKVTFFIFTYDICASCSSAHSRFRQISFVTSTRIAEVEPL